VIHGAAKTCEGRHDDTVRKMQRAKIERVEKMRQGKLLQQWLMVVRCEIFAQDSF